MVVSRVLPFRVNQYVLDELIDWDRVPDDPMYRLTFPQREMLRPDEYTALARLMRDGASEASLETLVREIRLRMNPHPAGQMTHNVPFLYGRPLPGLDILLPLFALPLLASLSPLSWQNIEQGRERARDADVNTVGEVLDTYEAQVARSVDSIDLPPV